MPENFWDQFNASSTSSTGSFGGNTKNAIDSITSKLGISGISNKIASLGSIDVAQKFASVSKYKDNFGSLYPLPGPSPEDVRESSTTPATTIQFPSDLADYSIIFTFFNSKQSTPIAPRIKLPRVSIALPIPGNLMESFNMGYADKQLGLLGVLEDTGVLTNDTLATAFNGSNSKEVLSDLTNKGSNLGAQVASPSGLFTASRGLANLSDTLGAGIDRSTGSVLNPHQALQFEGTGLRKHSFNFRFSPSSEKESRDLKLIIREFKARMHPEKTVLALNYPDECDIQIYTPAGVFDDYIKFKTCYLESMSVNYAPQGMPSFFSGGAHPTEIEISLNFGEIQPLTRQDFTSAEYTRDYKEQINTSKSNR